MVVFVSGFFKVIHPGHFRLLDYARRHGDKLIVGLLPDESSNDGTYDDADRVRNLLALEHVDEAFIVKEGVVKAIESIKPDVVVKGWEFSDKPNEEADILNKIGGTLLFSPNDSYRQNIRDDGLSNKFTDTDDKHFESYRRRRSFSHQDLLKLVNKAQNLKICVVGDMIVDKYVRCSAVGMSREDACVVIKPEHENRYIGGAAIVACHAKSIGADVTFLSASGDDDVRLFCEKELSSQSINYKIFSELDRVTTEKARYKVDGRTITRINSYKEHAISTETQDKIYSEFEKICGSLDLLIFSDFSFGVLPDKLVSRMISLAKQKGVFTSADSQTSSKLGDLGKFHGVDYVAPTEYEGRVTVNDYDSGLVEVSKKLASKLRSKYIVLTLGYDGAFMTQFHDSPSNLIGAEFSNDSLPALNKFPTDVGGAGDAFLVFSSMALSMGCSIWEAGYLGSVVSSIQISREGNLPVTTGDIRRLLS